MTHAAVRAPSAPRHLRPADDPVAQLAARGDALARHVERIEAEHAERMDLLAHHLALLVAENGELRALCDVLALYAAPIVAAHDARCADELAHAPDDVAPALPTAPAFTALDRELLPCATRRTQ